MASHPDRRGDEEGIRTSGSRYTAVQSVAYQGARTTEESSPSLAYGAVLEWP